MKVDFEIDTDGVLLLCSKKGLKNYFQTVTFDYQFPDGILPLVNKGIVAAIVTESGEEVTGEVRVMEGMNDKPKHQLSGEGKFYIEEDDELFVLSHGEFTQICDTFKGDIDRYEFRSEKISLAGLRKGWAFMFIHTKVTSKMPYIDVIFQLTYVNIEPPFADLKDVVAV